MSGHERVLCKILIDLTVNFHNPIFLHFSPVHFLFPDDTVIGNQCQESQSPSLPRTFKVYSLNNFFFSLEGERAHAQAWWGGGWGGAEGEGES